MKYDKDDYSHLTVFCIECGHTAVYVESDLELGDHWQCTNIEECGAQFYYSNLDGRFHNCREDLNQD